MTSNVQSNLENMPEHANNIVRVTVEQTMYILYGQFKRWISRNPPDLEECRMLV